MANIFRRLDELAGVVGGVVSGERARREQLLSEHLGRSQQSYMQRQRQTGMRQLQQARLDRDRSELNQRLQQDKTEFETRERREREEFKIETGLARDRIAALKARNLNAQAEAKEDRVKDQLTAYDREISNLVSQARMVASQKNALGKLGPEQFEQLYEIQQEIKRKRMEKESYSQAYMPPYILDKINRAKTMVEQARVRALSDYDRFNLKRTGPSLKQLIGNTTYKTDTTTTDADKVINPFDEFQ